MSLPPAKSWTLTRAGHLLARAGFGGTPDQIKALHSLGLQGAVDALLSPPADPEPISPPAWTADPRAVRFVLSQEEGGPTSQDEIENRKKRLREIERSRSLDLLDYWLARMTASPDPLREKLTLFWHDHFATSILKVQDAQLMWRQNELFRQLCFGRFPDLAKAVSRDPAMMIWLDMTRSSKQRPNENFARELFELFTLGEGNYSEADIRECARAFTGYRLEPPTRSFVLVERQHDNGIKSVFGRRGNFSGDGIIDLATARFECARLISGKLWEFFVSTELDDQLAHSVAEHLVRHDLEIGPFLRDIFLSEEFYAPLAIRSQIKSPVQWCVQMFRSLEVPPPPAKVMSGVLAQLGQVPFAPPNVGGWNGGRSWINSTTLILRQNFASRLLGLQSEGRRRRNSLVVNPDQIKLCPASAQADPTAAADHLCLRLFADPSPARVRPAAERSMAAANHPLDDTTLLEIAFELVSMPDYQLC